MSIIMTGCAKAQSSDISVFQQAEATRSGFIQSEQPALHPEYRSTGSGIPISYSLSDLDATEMLSIVRQHSQNAILGIILRDDGSVSVETGIVNVSGTDYIFRRENGKWMLVKWQDWLS